jgi:Flp pilus assembly protein TadB
MELVFVVALGVALALGLVGLFVSVGLAPRSQRAAKSPTTSAGPSSRVLASIRPGLNAGHAITAIASGMACALLTRWPAAAVFGVVIWLALPVCLHKSKPGASSRRAEAVAGWTELIRDSLSASSGLAQAVMTTAHSVPAPIRPEATALATRLANGIPLESALRSFAVDVDDPAAEFVVCALLLAASSRAQRLSEVLSSLVDSIRDSVAMQLRIDASRASAQSSVRTIIVFSLAFVLVLAAAAHSYLSPFGSAMGQLVLLGIGLLYAAGLGLMIKLVRPIPQPRLLDVGRLR